MRLTLISGPWGSGTSALAGAIAHLGIMAPEPYFVIRDDPRTPITYENSLFRETILGVTEEHNLIRTRSSAAIKEALQVFKKNLQGKCNLSENNQILLKLPLSAIVLDEISQVFQTKLVICLRPIADIEKSRQRRKWPAHFGAQGGRIIYAQLMEHIANNQDCKTLMIRYKDLLASPQLELRKASDFLELNPSEAEFQRSISSLRQP